MSQDRSPPVAEELSRLPALGTAECLEYLRANGDGLSPEALVHLLRASATSHDTSFFELCGRLLVGREGRDRRWTGGHCERIIMSLARYYGFHADPEMLRDFRSRCHAEMWRAVHAGRVDKPLWEEAFGYCLKQVCIQVARQMARQRGREQEREQPLHEWDEEEAAAGAPGSVLLEDEILGRIEEEILVAAIRRLPARQAQAVLLAWVEQRPIDASSEGSVKSIMGITGRGVYQLLEKARARLLLDPVIRAKRGEQ